MDTLNEDTEKIETPAVLPKKASAAEKKANGATKGKEVNGDSTELKTTKKEKVTKKAATKKSKPETVEPVKEDDKSDEVAVGEEEDSDDSDMDDQTLALLKGFESDGDEDDAVNDEVFTPGQEIPKLDAKAIGLTPKEQKKLKKLAQAGESEKPGVVYVGRIPHGFYENEMKAYFKQFGTILKIRLSRNKKTGQSKHFAWIQFESATVADIVARTMDNYLMFGHILKVKLIPDEQVHEDLFKGANKRFKKVPWNKIQGRKLEQGASEEQWDKRVEREEERREKKADKLKAIGYEFEAPKVKTTKEITKKEKAPLALTAEEEAEEPKAIEAALSTEQPSKPKKVKKAKAIKDAVPEVEPTLVFEEPSKPKKDKKSKATKDVAVEAMPTPATEPAKPKEKKRKAGKAVEVAAAETVADAPEKTIKKKKSKNVLAGEPDAAAAEVSGEKVKKPKKSKN